MEKSPKIIEGGITVDDRGSVSFVNDFNFDGVKRFYQVYNFTTSVIRAFHGHKKEAKHVYVPTGSALILAVALEELEGKGEQVEKVYRYVLSSKRPSVLYIPENYANGFRALEADTSILFFSTSTLEESKEDDIRFPYDVLGREVWEIENR